MCWHQSMAVIASPLADYLQKIRAIPRLSAAAELQLALRIQSWLQQDRPSPAQQRRLQRALQRLVCTHLRLVVCLAQRQWCDGSPQAGLELLDLVQAGNLGLIQAAQRYQPSQGHRFSSFACWWINQAIQRHRHDLASLIRLPESLLELSARARALQARSAAPLRCAVLARELGTSPARLVQALTLRRSLQPLSLDQPIVTTPGQLVRIETMADQHSNPIEETYEWLHDQVLQLASGERQVLRLRYLVEGSASIALIARHTGMSRSQISRCEQRALRKLRQRVACRSC
jgi:RNA polymerase primary sigma factor